MKFCSKKSYALAVLTAIALVGFVAGGAMAADYTLTQPSTDIASDITTGGEQKVKIGTAATGSSNRMLIFTTATGVLDETNSDSGCSATSGVVTFADPGAGNIAATEHVVVITSDSKVSAPFLGGVAGDTYVEEILGIAGQTAVAGTGATAVLSAAKADDFAGQVYIPVRSLMTGGVTPTAAQIVPAAAGASISTAAPAISTDNPFLVYFTGDGDNADFAAGNIVLDQTVASTSVLDDAAGNTLNTNDPLTIANAAFDVAGGAQALYVGATANRVNLARVTNTAVVFSATVSAGDSTTFANKTQGLAVEKTDSKFFIVASDGTDEYAVNPTVKFVNWDTMEFSIAQGVTVSKWDGAAVDTGTQLKLYVNTDGQFFLTPTTSTYSTLTEILDLTAVQKAAASVDDGAAGAGDGRLFAQLTMDMLVGALEDAAGTNSAAAANIVLIDDAAPWIYAAKSRIDAADAGNDGSEHVNTVDLYVTEAPAGTSGTNADDRLMLWVDVDADGVIDDLGLAVHNELTDADEIFYIPAGDVAAALHPEIGRGNTILRLDTLTANLMIDPDLDIRVRLMAAGDRLKFIHDAAGNYYEPFLGDQTMDVCRYDLFDDRATVDIVAPEDPDYSTDYPDYIKVGATSYGLAVTDKAPAGIETLEMVTTQASATTTALVYIKFSEPVIILDFDGTGDSKNSRAAELFEFNDTSAAAVAPFTGNIYRMTTGKLNDIKTAGAVVVGTTVESDLDATSGQEFILEMTFPGVGVLIATASDTLEVQTWSGKILDTATVANSTLVTEPKLIAVASTAPALPVASRAIYTAGNSFIDLVFTTDVQAVNSNTDLAATVVTKLNDAFTVYDGSGTTYATTVVVSQPVATTELRLTWSSVDKLPTTTGLTVAYAPTNTNNATDEYAVIGHASDPSASYQVSAFTIAAVEIAYTAKTADLNFDGYVDAIYIDLGTVLLDTTVVPAASGFSLATTEWRGYNDNALADIVVKTGQTLNPSSVTVENHYDTDGVVDESFIVLHFASTFDWNPDTTTVVEAPKTNASGFVTISYSGTDVLTSAGATVSAFYVGAVTDGAAPAILSAQRSGSTIVMDVSENLAATIAGAADNNEAAGFFVFKDSNGYIMDMTEWDILSYDVLAAAAPFTNTQVVVQVQDSAGADSSTIAKQVGYVYVSQKYAADNAYTGQPMREGANRTGKSIYLTDPAAVPASAYQTYDSFTGDGTKVAVSQVELPTFEEAFALWNVNGYYDKVLVILSETASITNAGGTDLENSFLISLQTDDNLAAGQEVQMMKPDAVSISGTHIILTISQARQEASGSSTAMDVYPVKVYYVDNSVAGTSTTVEYLADADTNYMRDGNVSITKTANDRTADVRSVEVSGTLTGFDYQGAQIKAYEAYKYLSVTESTELSINFEYGPLNKVTQGAFGIRTDGTDQCHQEGIYTGIYYMNDGVNAVQGAAFLTGGITVKNIMDRGYCYLHTDFGGNNLFDFGLSFDADSKSKSTAALSPSDSVFKLTVTKKANKTGGYTLAVTGPYGIRGTGSYGERVVENWFFYEGSVTDAAIANLNAQTGTTAVVGTTVIPFDATTAAYKVVARDEVGTLLDVQSTLMTDAQKVIASRIMDKRVILTLTDVDGNVYLLNGVTDDVAIEYNFYNYDGAFVYNADLATLFGYDLTQTAWNTVPVVVDKVYYSSSKAPSTLSKYPDGTTSRATAKINVESVGDAIIGLNGGLPVIAADNAWIFGLDGSGVAYGVASDLDYLKGGYGYAVLEGATGAINADTIWFFGYNMPLSGYSDGAKLTANVIDVDSKSSARTTKNLGWNLIADVADISLPSTKGLVDYVITFRAPYVVDGVTITNGGIFDSWIEGGASHLQDFTAITDKYNAADTAGKLGKAYFVHTAEN